MPNYAKSLDQVASACGVSRQTVIEWKRRGDFPTKTKTKGWNLDQIEEWTQSNSVGKHRHASNGESGSLSEANRKLRNEQAENERIKKERQLVEQAEELGEIVLLEDVQKLYRETVATISVVHDSLVDVVDRSLPEEQPTAEQWPETRERILDLCRKLKRDASSAMQELLED